MVGAGRKGETLLTCYRDNHDDVTGIYIEEANSKSNSKFDSRWKLKENTVGYMWTIVQWLCCWGTAIVFCLFVSFFCFSSVLSVRLQYNATSTSNKTNGRCLLVL